MACMNVNPYSFRFRVWIFLTFLSLLVKSSTYNFEHADINIIIAIVHYAVKSYFEEILQKINYYYFSSDRKLFQQRQR